VRVERLIPCVALLLSLPGMAAAQGRPAPASDQAFLYEMSENATVVVAGNNLHRQATSELQGVAAYPSPLCPLNTLVTNPKSDTCTVTATGSNDVVLDVSTAQPIPTSGAVWGTFAVVVQLDNPVDSPELPVITGAFFGTITFGQPGVPIGSASGSFVLGGQLSDVVGGQPSDPQLCTKKTCQPFTAKFRQPFAMSAHGERVKPRRGRDAFYLGDNGHLIPVRQDERAVGWPTVRFEINFP
jgi:hypothetical protein